MRGPGRGLLAVVVLAFAVAASCGRSKPVDGPDASPEGGVTVRAACLDRPDELPRPPTAGLPCDLIPPGLTL